MHCLTGNEDDPDTFTTMKKMMPMMMIMFVMMLTMMLAHMSMKSMSAKMHLAVVQMVKVQVTGYEDDDTSTPMMNTMPKMIMMFDVHHVNEINVSKDAFRGCAATEHVQGCVSICPSD